MELFFTRLACALACATATPLLAEQPTDCHLCVEVDAAQLALLLAEAPSRDQLLLLSPQVAELSLADDSTYAPTPPAARAPWGEIAPDGIADEAIAGYETVLLSLHGLLEDVGGDDRFAWVEYEPPLAISK